MLRSHTVYTFMLAVQDSKHMDCGSMSKLDLFNEIMNYLHVVTTSCWQRLVVMFLIGDLIHHALKHPGRLTWWSGLAVT